ncbi:hypothetical protein M3Y97_00430600 [Aphelenchoides bicaudatus]|nr:hypothetical protein M3Y97_00430600 [Aphelenchoides bicaudatus]
MYFWAEKMVAKNKNQAKELVKQQKLEAGTSKRHSLKPGSGSADVASIAKDIAKDRAEIAAVSGPPASGTSLLVNILRALFARAIFIAHSLLAIGAAVSVHKDNSIWTFSLISVSIVIEGAYTIVMRAGDERKWFSPSILLYILATAPSIWLLEKKLCEWRQSQTADLDDKLQYQVLEQLLLVVLIVGRWLLPKGDISREQLSQILLAYLAISSDIVEFFDVFKARVVYQNLQLQYIVLSAWTLSLFQFPFILTISRARKMRLAITNEETLTKRSRPEISQIIYDIDIWAIILANSLQDIPFFLVRIYLIVKYKLITYTMIFFLCKNVLIIVLQTYRGFVLFNDRYVHPKAPSTAELILEQRQHRRASHTSNHESPTTNARSEKRRATLAERRPTGISKVPRRSVQSGLSDEAQIAAEHAPVAESSRRASTAPHHTTSKQIAKATKIASPIIEKCNPMPAPPSKQEKRPRSSFDDYID